MELKFIQSIVRLLLAAGFILTNSISEELLHGPIVGQANITSNKVSVIFYREKSNDTENVPTVFMNDHIVASLLPGEYTQTRVCDSSIKLRVATRGDVVAKGPSKRINISKNTIAYVKILKTKNKTFAPLIVDETQGKKELQSIQRTSHILNRYVPKITLGTDSLFAFNSAKLLPSAYPTLNKLAHDITMCPYQNKRIKIIGHTDRIGSEKVNHTLSLKRAQEVANYLTEKGIKTPMDIEGHGSKKPVTMNCKGKISPQLIQCLQADRRVVIEY